MASLTRRSHVEKKSSIHFWGVPLGTGRMTTEDPTQIMRIIN